MAEAKKKQAEAGSKNRSSEIVDNLLSKGKKNGGTLTYGELVEALQTQDLSPDEIDNMYDEEENSEKMYQREKELQEDNKDNLLNFMKEHGFSVPTGEYGEKDIFVKDQYMVSQYDINYLYLNEFGKPAKKIKAKDLDAETPKKSNPLYEYLLSINAKLDRGLNDCTVSFKNKYGQDVEIYLYHEDLDISNIDDKDYRKFKHVIPQELDATKENVERIYNTKFNLKK